MQRNSLTVRHIGKAKNKSSGFYYKLKTGCVRLNFTKKKIQEEEVRFGI